MFEEVIEICNNANDATDELILPCNGLQDKLDEFEAGFELISRDILETGITPLNSTECNGDNNSTSAPKSTDINLDCYAYMSISPFSENSIESIGLDIERGISFAGQLTLFDKFEAAGRGKVS